MTADELAEQITTLTTDLQRRTAEEVRAEIATEIEHRDLGKPGRSRAVYRDATPEDCLLLELRENPALQKDPILRAYAARIEEDGMSEDFHAGVLFAGRLLTDLEFEY